MPGPAIPATMLVSQTSSGVVAPISRAVSQSANSKCPNNWPSWTAMLPLVTGQYMYIERASEIVSYGGAAIPDFNDRQIDYNWEPGGGLTLEYNKQGTNNPYLATLWASFKRIPEQVIKTLFLRDQIDADEATAIMRKDSYSSEAEVKAIQSTWMTIPGPDSIAQMTALGGVSLDAIASTGLLEEMTDEYLAWSQASGSGLVTIGASDANGVNYSANFAANAWAAHWSLPSSGEVASWAVRFRQNPTEEFESLDPSGLILPQDQIDFLLKATAVAPPLRPFVQAAKFRQLSIRYLQTAIQYGGLERKDVLRKLMAQGFYQTDAETIYTALQKKADVAKFKQVTSAAHINIESAWQAGIIGDDDFTSLMQSAGLDETQAQQALSMAQTVWHMQRSKQILAAIRKQYLSGQESRTQTHDALAQIGIDPNKISAYLGDWDMILEGERKFVQVAKIIDLVKKKVLPLSELVNRLTNLHYATEDISVIIADINYAWQVAAEKLIKQEASAEAKAEKAKEAAQRQQQLQFKQLQAELAKHGNPAELGKWYKQGLITEAAVRSRLEFLGWPDEDISRLEQSIFAVSEHETQSFDESTGKPKHPPAISISQAIQDQPGGTAEPP